jgi:hypothetical protein
MTIALENDVQTSRKKWLVPALHALAWALYIAYELLYVFLYTGKWGNVRDDLLFYVAHAGLFYCHALWVLPLAFERSSRPFFTLALLLVAEMIVYILLKYGLSYWLDGFRLSAQSPAKVKEYLSLSAWRAFYFLPFSTAYWLLRRLFIFRTAINRAEKEQLMILKEKAEVERNLADVQNAYLQHQINPHFLFNTLNFVYSTVYQISPAASECIQRLSDIMRYSLGSFDGGAEGSLEEEIEQIRNLVAVNRMRFHYDLALQMELPAVSPDLKIIPLVLLTFSENVFKHADLTSPATPASIRLTLTEQRLLTFTTRNVPKRRASPTGSHRVGIENAKKRLDYAYGSNYRLQIADTPEYYQLDLWIQL